MTTAKTPQGRMLSALLIADHAKWFKRVKTALIDHNGQIATAARSLNIEPRQLWRWVRAYPDLLEGTGYKPGRLFGHD